MEIAGGLGVIYPETRQLASRCLALFLIAVYPAILYLAFYEQTQQSMGISSFAASWGRLPIQFIFLGLAYWHSKD